MFIIVIEDIEFKNNHFRNYPKILSSEPSPEKLLKVLETLGSKEEKVIITWASTSLLDLSLISRLPTSDNYDIIFIPNLPEYMEFEIWDVSFLISKLKNLSTIKKPLRSSISQLEVDESLFFVDIYQPDIRLYRFEFTPNSLKGRKAIEYLYKNIDFSKEIIPQILNLTRAKPEILTEIPTFYMFEISDKKVGDESIDRSWYTNVGNLSFENFTEIFDKIKSISKEFSVVLGVYNEPLFNRDIFRILEFVNSDDLDGITFILSTSLPYVDDNLLKIYASSSGKKGYKSYDRFYIFVNLPRINSERLSVTVKNIDILRDVDNKRVFVRFVRDRDSVKYLPDFYEKMKNYNFIIYRTFDKELMDADNVLPVRVPCYKLQTSLIILPDGSVPLCLNDLSLDSKLGNIFVDDISKIALVKAEYLNSHFSGNYMGICENCVIWDQYDL